MLTALKGIPIKLGPVRFFVLCGLTFGLLFLVITPPFQGPDEVVHFYHSYQVSEGNFVADKLVHGIGGALPASLGTVVTATTTPPVQFHPNFKYDEHATRRALSVPLNATKQANYDFSSAANYSPIPYLPSSSMILAGRLVHLNPLLLFYLARLGDLLCWLLVMALAIRLMPWKKWALVAIGLLPMALFEAATINGDVVTVGSAALFLAFILRLRERSKKISNPEIGALLLIASLMVLSKQVMFVFLPLVLLLKNKAFVSKRAAIAVKILLTALPLSLFLGWLLVTSHIDITASYTNQQDPAAQTHFILKSPFSFINVLWNTYFYTWGDSITRSFIGTFGWMDAPLSEVVVTLGYIGLAFLLIAAPVGDRIKALARKEKLLVAVLVLAYWLAVSASLYLYYSPVEFKIIVGLQGRYFIPAALLLIPLLYSGSIIVSKKLYSRVAIGLPLFLLVASVITLYVRYFINNV